MASSAFYVLLYHPQANTGAGKGMPAAAPAAKACMQCGTTHTPQWRTGPCGPSTLCNACGVKRLRAIKAQQQGKNPGQVPQAVGAGTKKKAAAMTVRFVECSLQPILVRGDMPTKDKTATRFLT